MAPMAPDERVFREHVNGARFRDGVSRGRWRLVGEIEWPCLLVAVAAGPRESGPPEFFLRVDLAGYPQSAPTLTPWDPATQGVLGSEQRPKGEFVGPLFRTDWENGTALYAPFDRVGLSAHPGWRQEHPRHSWDATRDLSWVLQILHEWLNDAGYIGV